MILAVETGGTKLQFVLGRKDGSIFYEKRIEVDPEQGCVGIQNAVMRMFPLMQEQASIRGEGIECISFGFGAPVNLRDGSVFASMQIEGWNGFPLKTYMEEKTKTPVFVFNDTDAAAWGEYVLGTGIGSGSFFYTNIGSGIGGGFVRDGILFTGQGKGAMEFGQTCIGSDGERVEEICSGWAIQEYLRNTRIPKNSLLWDLCGGRQRALTCKEWNTAIQQGDSFSLTVLRQRMKTFSMALANVIHLLAPEVIAVGGGVSLIGEPLLNCLREYTDQYMRDCFRGTCSIRQASLGERAVPLGALLLAAGKQ